MPPPIIKSFSFSQDRILQDIMTLYTGDIQVDATFGSGCFYKRFKRPEFCFDLSPKKDGVIQADCCNLPLDNNSVRTLMFDPPFLARTGPGAIMKSRFGELVGTIEDLHNFYFLSLREFHRVLATGGWLVFKCQDGVLSGVNNNTYVKICNMAESLGLSWIDMFIILAKRRMTHPKQKVQRHARKFHSYFVIFKKKGKLPANLEQPKLNIELPPKKQIGLVL